MEITNAILQVVEPQANVLFTDTVVGCGNSLLHREGSGLVTLKGNATTQCRARYRVSFGGNVALPAAGTVGPIQLAIALNGEAVASTTMIQTPAAVGDFSNVFSAIFIDIPRGCCQTVSVKNISTEAIEVQNANLIVERVA